MTDEMLNDARWIGESIIYFLKQHGKRGADGEWNSPDACEMENAAVLMMNWHAYPIALRIQSGVAAVTSHIRIARLQSVMTNCWPK